MNKLLMSLFARLLLASLLLNSSAVIAADNVVTLRADLWFPANGEPNSNEPGYMIELAEKAFASAGMSIDYQLLPWTRAINTVRQGEFDCVIGTTRTTTPDFIFPKQRWGTDTTSAYVKKNDDWRYKNINSLKNRDVAIIQDYDYGDELNKYIAQHRKTFQSLGGEDALKQNIHKLFAGRVDTILENQMVMTAAIKKLPMEESLQSAGDLSGEAPLYIACSPANKERSKKLVNIIDTQTEALRRSGELAKILTKYDLKDWQ
jgi:polar amino acid transport system substrate-binding protein